MTSRPTRSAASRIASGDASPSPRSECSWRSARPMPKVLEDGPLLRRAAHVALEHSREALHALAHVGIAVAGVRDLERRLEGCGEDSVAASGERRYERRAGAQREHDGGGRQQRFAPEELDLLADAGDRAVREDAEHLALTQEAEDAQRGIGADELQACATACAVHGPLELRGRDLDR